MDAVVTARVPVEVKEHVGDMLRERGSSPAELINAAYEYYRRYGELPQVGEARDDVCITLTPKQVAQLEIRLMRGRCAAPSSFRGGSLGAWL